MAKNTHRVILPTSWLAYGPVHFQLPNGRILVIIPPEDEAAYEAWEKENESVSR